MPFLLVEADLTSNPKWPPDVSNMSSVFACFILGTKHRRKRVKVSFPTKYGMAFLFMESDLTSDPIWLRPTMSNVQTCPVWISVTLVQGLWDILVGILAIAPNLVQMLSITYLIILRWVPSWPPHDTAILRITIWLSTEKN